MKKKHKLSMLELNKRLIKELIHPECETKPVGYANKGTAQDVVLKYKIKNQF